MKNFLKINSDYPLRFDPLKIEDYQIDENEVPQGYGGINKEQYSYKQLCHQPIVSEVIEKLSHPVVKEIAEECNKRNREAGFKMYKVNGEYCFWGLRLLPTVKTPNLSEIKEFLYRDAQSLDALNKKAVAPRMIRNITYMLLREEIAKACGVNAKVAANIIGNELDCAPHEDLCGYIYMVPNWAHNWFRHDGYVKQMLALLNI